VLQRDEVEEDERRLRDVVGGLPNDARAEFYRRYHRRVRDPDTYAVLNYLLVSGMHHLYLGKWIVGLLEFSAFVLSIVLLFFLPALGILILLTVSCIELWALFRSQIIVMDYNNEQGWAVYEDIVGAFPQNRPRPRHPM